MDASSKIKNFMNNTTPQSFLTLQKKIQQYQENSGMDPQKTYSRLLEFGHPPLSSHNKSRKPIDSNVSNNFETKERLSQRNARRTHTSMNLNDTKIMKKTKLSVILYEKSLNNNEKNAEETLIKNFSIAKHIIHDIANIYQTNGYSLLFGKKCENLKEKLLEIYEFLEDFKENFLSENFNHKNSSFFRKDRAPINPFLKKESKFIKKIHDYSEEINVAFRIKKFSMDFDFDRLEESIDLKNENFLIKNALQNNKKSQFELLKDSYDSYFSKLIDLIHSHSIKELYVCAMLLHSKVCFESKQLNKAVIILKQAKNICNDTGLWDLKLKCYEKLGKCFQSLKNFTLSLRYYMKMLEIAIYTNSKSKELLAYDLIGLQYFYAGDLSLANFFHKKLIKGEAEQENSTLRRIAILKYKYKLPKENYSLPNYIALRTSDLGKLEGLMEPSSNEEADLKIEELLESYKNRGSDGNWIKMTKGFPNKKLALQAANKNIRMNKKPALRIASFDADSGNQIIDFNKLIKINSTSASTKNFGQNHPFLRINHLSPNRYFSKPNIYEFRMNKLNKDENEKLNKNLVVLNERHLEKLNIRFQSFLEKFRNNIRVALLQLEFYLFRAKDNSSSRKNALYCSPLIRKLETPKTAGSMLFKTRNFI